MVRAQQADDDLATAISRGRWPGKRGRPQPAAGRSSPVPMDEQQGNTDAQDLLQNGALSPDAQARLNAATTLSPDQQAALERGDLVLPHDQMAYLAALSRGMDGKTTGTYAT